MSRLKELIDELCPDGVEYLKVRDVASVERGVRVVKKQLSSEPSNGLHPVFQNSLAPLGYHTAANYKAGTAYIIGAGGAGGIGYCEEDFWAADDCFPLVPGECVLGKYLFYVMDANQIKINGTVRQGTIPRISRDDIGALLISVPPIEVQREIVRVLDAMQELDDSLGDELSARTLQMRHCVDALIGISDSRPDESWGKLCDLCESIVDGDHQAPPQADSRIPFLVISNFNTGRISLTDTKHVIPEYYANLDSRRKPAKDDVLLSVTGSYGIAALVEDDEPFCFQRHVALLKPKANPLFVLALMRSGYAQRYFDNVVTGSAQKTIPLTQLRSMPVPPISAERQEIIAESFNAMIELANLQELELANRRKQFEYYRDRLLNFPEKAVS